MRLQFLTLDLLDHYYFIMYEFGSLCVDAWNLWIVLDTGHFFMYFWIAGLFLFWK